MRTERYPADLLAECFQAHRKLWERAAELSREVAVVKDSRDYLELGSSCMQMAANDALASRDPRVTLQRWRDCGHAEQQIRLATFWALRAGAIDAFTYDLVFQLASAATKKREEQRQRLRRELLARTII